MIVNDGAEDLCLFSSDIRGRFSLSRSLVVMPTEMIPDPCLITNLMVSGVANNVANKKFPLISTIFVGGGR